MATVEDIQRMIASDPDYIALRRYEHSLEYLLARYPNDCPDHIIAGALALTEDEVEVEYDRIVRKLRQLMGVVSL